MLNTEQHWTLWFVQWRLSVGRTGTVDSGNKKQINVGHSQIYYTGVPPGEDRQRKAREGGARNGEGGRAVRGGRRAWEGWCLHPEVSLLPHHTGQAFIYKRTRFLPTFPVSFGFGLARKATRIAWHVEFWLSPANSEAQESHSRAFNLLQTSSEAELGGRDGGRQAKTRVPSSHLYLAAGCWARLGWQQQTMLVSRKNLITW